MLHREEGKGFARPMSNCFLQPCQEAHAGLAITIYADPINQLQSDNNA